MTSCSDFLANAYYNKVNQFNQTPFPVFFEGENCTGGTWPSSFKEIETLVKERTVFTIPNKAKKIYVPLNLTVIIDKKAYNGPILQNLSIFTNMDVQVIQKQEWSLYTIDICSGHDITISSKALTKYDTNNCDTFMKSHCNHNSSNPVCACFADQRDLDQKYPNMNPSVICFGPNCIHGGYRTQDMIEAGCSPAICEKFIQDNEHKLTGVNSVTCNNDSYPISPSASPPPSVDPPQNNNTVLYVVITILVIVIASISLVASFVIRRG